MPKPPRHPLFSGVSATGLGTLVSRVLGVLRESAAAGLLGLSQGGVMDAYVVAFRIPNLFRRLFGEGAMTASYLPVLAEDLEQDRRRAWKLVSLATTTLLATLALVVVLAEAVCWGLRLAYGDLPGMRLVLGLTAVMLPYTIFICLAAMASATLQTLHEFRVPAMIPSVMNVCWLVTAWLIAPRISSDTAVQAYVMAWCVLVGGALQWFVQWPALRKLGFRFELDFAASRQALGRVARGMIPTTLGLAVLQINTLLDSLLARGFSVAPGEPDRIAWLGGVRYPMAQGAAAAVWYGERIYQFPLGLLGIAVATVIFPLLSRHAARGDFARVGADLTLGLRLVLFGAVPAAAGLFFLAEPIAQLLFEHHHFTHADTLRAAAMIAAYSIGVWAYCASPVLVRGFYALNDRVTPLRIGLLTVGVNLAMNLVLIWPLGEIALAVSTAAAASFQVVLLVRAISGQRCPLNWRELRGTALRTLAATAAMAIVVRLALAIVPPGATFSWTFARVMLPLTAGGLAYLAAFRLMKGPELEMLWGRLPERSDPSGGTGSDSVPYAEPLPSIAPVILMAPEQELRGSKRPRLEQPVH
jgi:putative peptidoglycan lipid II flippase